MKKLFITFEGGEGCGKSTHSKLLKKYLVSRGFRVVLTLEPGGTVMGGKLRQMLLKSGKLLSRYSELFLFAADRLEHMEKVIKPALKARKIVISDRFVDSTTAYQMGGRKLPGSLVSMINNISSEGIMPDITILLDVPPKKGIRRGTRLTGKDRFESEANSFHQRVRRTYLSIAGKEKRRVRLVPSAGPIMDVQQRIRKIINEKL